MQMNLIRSFESGLQYSALADIVTDQPEIKMYHGRSQKKSCQC